jgi:hypothetical protein
MQTLTSTPGAPPGASEARVTGIAAGVHAAVALPGAYDESAIRREAARRGIRLATRLDYRAEGAGGPPS